MESGSQAQGSVLLGNIPGEDATIQSDTTEKKQRWNETETLELVAGPLPASCLTDSDPDRTPTQDNGHKDRWLQEIRHSQGNYEQEVTSGEEADLCIHYNICAKNPGHVQFIDVNSFQSEHLPERYRNDHQIIDLVRAQADLTCLIKVSYVSPDRPETSPFYKYRGRSDFSRSGTGWARFVIIYTEEDKRDGWYSPCGCQTCQRSGEPRSEWAEVRIFTANHVVFDKREAESCKCYFFYDNAEQKLSECPVFAGTQVHQVYPHCRHDSSMISYYSHDLVWARRLKDTCDHYYNLCVDMNKKYGTISLVVTGNDPGENEDDIKKDDNTQVRLLSYFPTSHGVQEKLSQSQDCVQGNSDDEEDVSESDGDDDYFDDDDDRYNPEHGLVIITSHPHACSKMVTVGQVTDRHGQTYTSYEYSTATCPGCSGAPVFVLGKWFGRTFHTHSGRVKGHGSQQVNCSGVNVD